MSTHTCPAPNCTVEVRNTQFACIRHWSILPKDLQRKLNAAWKARVRESSQETRREHTLTMGECIKWLAQNAEAHV